MMPTAADRGNGEQLAYKEAVLLTDPSNPEFRGEVDDKYQYSIEDKDNKVHGWISTDESVGFWMITPSDEFRTGGPFKQDLTSHVGPTTLSVSTTTKQTCLASFFHHVPLRFLSNSFAKCLNLRFANMHIDTDVC